MTIIDGEDTLGPGSTKYNFEQTHTALQSIRYYMKNRILFKTQRGYFGLGPRWLRPGDEVVIFDGGETPFVLTPWQNAWKVVGDCYLHGWMDGNHFRFSESKAGGGLAKADFKLC